MELEGLEVIDRWHPDPVDANPLRSQQSRRNSDTIGMLIGIYGSKDLFIKEYRCGCRAQLWCCQGQLLVTSTTTHAGRHPSPCRAPPSDHAAAATLLIWANLPTLRWQAFANGFCRGIIIAVCLQPYLVTSRCRVMLGTTSWP